MFYLTVYGFSIFGYKEYNQSDLNKCDLLYTVRLGTDCGSDEEHLIAKFRLKLKKVEKTTRPFRYDLNQIPYDYIVEVRNRFKGLDLIEYLMNYGRKFLTILRR